MKRFFDIMVGCCLLLPGLPIMALVGIGVAVNLGRPVLFRQQRPGLHGRLFEMMKFRTMTNEVDDNGNLLPDEQRLTPFSRFLRATSFDELPELFNVIKGDMSLVGPRPLLVEYLGLYSTEQARRHEVRPGITGWAQINGRNTLRWQERLAMDVWYVDNHSLLLDCKILLLTVWKVVRRDGISEDGQATMSKFTGNKG